jgi:hypothetical protein
MAAVKSTNWSMRGNCFCCACKLNPAKVIISPGRILLPITFIRISFCDPKIEMMPLPVCRAIDSSKHFKSMNLSARLMPGVGYPFVFPFPPNILGISQSIGIYRNIFFSAG